MVLFKETIGDFNGVRNHVESSYTSNARAKHLADPLCIGVDVQSGPLTNMSAR